MKWETIKKTVARGMYTHTLCCESGILAYMLIDLLGSNFDPIRMLPEGERSACNVSKLYADRVYDRIMAWDIRMVGRLRELFGGYFPPSLREGPLVAGYDEKGNWEVVSGARRPA